MREERKNDLDADVTAIHVLLNPILHHEWETETDPIPEIAVIVDNYRIAHTSLAGTLDGPMFFYTILPAFLVLET